MYDAWHLKPTAKFVLRYAFFGRLKETAANGSSENEKKLILARKQSMRNDRVVLGLNFLCTFLL